MKINFFFPYKNKLEMTGYTNSGPMGLAYIYSNLKKHFNIEDIKIEVDVNRIIKNKPDIVGISTYTQNFSEAIKASKIIKQKLNIPIIIGGSHITALPDSLPESIDFGVIGEGEETMVNIIKLYKINKLTPKDLDSINGIVYRDHKKLKITKVKLIKNIDMLPIPDRQILYTYPCFCEYKWSWSQNNLFTSRGCPFKCRFCDNSKNLKLFRFHSPERVLEEIESILSIQPKVEWINIFDDIFVTDKERLHKIVELICRSRINKKIKFSCQTKAELFDEEICKLLKMMNVRIIAFGFESGSNKVLRYLKSKSASIDKNQNAINLCSKYEIDVVGYFILGAPDETLKDISKTYWFIRNNKFSLREILIFCLIPYPGTLLWDEFLIQKKLRKEDINNWQDFNLREFYSNDFLFMNKHYSFETLKNIYDKFQDLKLNISDQVLKKLKTSNFFINYQRAVYYEILSELENKKQTLLEISNFSHNIKNVITTNSNLEVIHYDLYKWNKEFSINYDVLFLNHCLEYNPLEIKNLFSQEFSNYDIDSNKNIFISVYNIFSIYFISELLNHSIIDFSFLDYKTNLKNFFTLKTIEKFIQSMGIRIDSIKKVYIESKENSIFRYSIKFLLEFFELKEYNYELNVMSYLFKCNIK